MLNFGGVTTWQLYEITPYSQIESSKIHQMTSYCPWLIRILISWPYMFNSSPTSKQKKPPGGFSSNIPETKNSNPAPRAFKSSTWRFSLGAVWAANVGNGLDGLHNTHRFPPKKRDFWNRNFPEKDVFLVRSSVLRSIPENEKVANTTSSNRFMNRFRHFSYLTEARFYWNPSISILKGNMIMFLCSLSF